MLELAALWVTLLVQDVPGTTKENGTGGSDVFGERPAGQRWQQARRMAWRGLARAVGLGLEAAEDIVDAVDGLVQAFEAG
jgi:hypothetical protein